MNPWQILYEQLVKVLEEEEPDPTFNATVPGQYTIKSFTGPVISLEEES